METFVGLDVSLGETSVCILDKDGTRIFEGKVASEPAVSQASRSFWSSKTGMRS